MSCILRAGGANFAVDEFLSGSSLKPIAVFRRGAPRFPASQPDGRRLTSSGFNVVASEAGFPYLQAQIADAVHFMEQNQAELVRLVAFPGIEEVSVDFGIEELEVAAQSERFPPSLLGIMGNLGIWLQFTLYPGKESDARPDKLPDESPH